MTGRPVGSVDRVLRQVAVWGLPGTDDIDAIRDGDATALVGAARAERLLGPLLAAVGAGALDLDADHLAEAVEAHLDAMRWCLQVERRALEVASWFEAVGGVEALVVKGPAVAHLDEPDPSLRFFADLDLLVAADDLDRAIAALEAHGARRRIPEHRPGFDRRFGRSVGLTSPDQVEIDVHRTLAVGALGFRIPLEEIFDRSVPFHLGGVPFRAPCLEHRLLHAVYHAVIGTPAPALRTVRDLAGYLTADHLDVAAVVAEAARWGGVTVLGEAVRTVLDTVPVALPEWERWLAAQTPSRRDLRLIELSRRERLTPIDWEVVRELGPVDGATFAWAVAFPSPAALAARGQTGAGRVVDGVARLRRRHR